MALALKDRVKETTIVVGTGTATLLGSSIGFQPFSVVGNGNTTYYCISDQFGSNWEVGIGTYSSSGNTLARTTVLASSNGGALVVFTSGVKDVFVTYPAEKGVWLDASNNAIGLGTPAAFVGTNITGTASGLTAGNVTTNANLSGAVSSIGNSTSLGSFTSAQLALAISDETGTGKAVFATNPTLTSPTYAGTLTGSTDILNIGSGQIYKDASGNVGIGTSSPYNATTDVLTVTRNQNAITQLLIDNQNVGASSQTRLALEASGAGWYIAHQKTGNVLTFTNVTTERMRIDGSGNVGIGTSSPGSRLDIRSPNVITDALGQVSVYANDFGINYGGSIGLGGAYNIALSTFTDYTQIAGRKENSTSGDYAGYLSFATRINAGPITERMRIDSSGNVGIGCTPNVNFGVKLQLGSYQGIGASYVSQNLGYYPVGGVYNWRYPLGTTGWLSGSIAVAGGSAYYFQIFGAPACAGAVDSIASSLGSLYYIDSSFNHVWQRSGSAESMRIDSSGNFLVGTTSGSYKITCNGQPGANGYTAWTNYSDQRLKKNITEFKGGLKEVLNLKPKSFNYNELSGYDEDTRNRTVSGFVAQELELVCPEMVGTTEINGVEYLDTNTSNLNLLLVKAIQELKAIIDTQQEQINSLLGL